MACLTFVSKRSPEKYFARTAGLKRCIYRVACSVLPLSKFELCFLKDHSQQVRRDKKEERVSPRNLQLYLSSFLCFSASVWYLTQLWKRQASEFERRSVLCKFKSARSM